MIKTPKKPKEKAFLCLEILLLLFFLAFQLINILYVNYYPAYFQYDPEALVDYKEPELLPCKDGLYICEERWAVGREPYIKQELPVLYWILSNQNMLLAAYIFYFIGTQHKKLYRIFKKVVKNE